MRHEVLYQYDLPIEILDDIPRTEEVLTVIYARSKEKYLIPVLFTRLRMVWGYPERETVYRIYEMNYIDLAEAEVRFPTALTPTLIIKTVNNDKYIFHGIKNTIEEVRAALLTLSDMMQTKVGGNWKIAVKRNLLMEVYLLRETEMGASDLPGTGTDDVFEDEPVPEPVEELYDPFPERKQSGDDVFEKQSASDNSAKEWDTAKATWVSRMVESTEPAPVKEEEKKIDFPPVNDAVVFDTNSGKMDEQWHDEGKGDAMILPGGGRNKVGGAKYKHLANEQKSTTADDDSVVYDSKTQISQSRPDPRIVSSITLEPREGLDDEAVDKSLDALKYLRENGIITEDEYKKRCLVLFKKTGL